MAIRITVDRAKELDDGVILAPIGRGHLSVFGKPLSKDTGPNVLFLRGEPDFNADAETVTFDADSVRYLNEGGGDETVIVCGMPTIAAREMNSSNSTFGSLKGDEAYLLALKNSNIPKWLEEAGIILLQKVREFYDGHLEMSKKGRFIERPLNFWTVKPQPRDGSLSITVYGKPARLSALAGSLELKPDMTSYSRFKIRGVEDVRSAVQVIKMAYRFKHQR